MNTNHPVRVLLLPAALRALLVAALVVCGLRPAAAQGLDLKAAIDDSIHWLSAQQDMDTGRYGAGVLDTCLVLEVYAESPRHYKRTDGPFVGRALSWLVAQQDEDGSIHDPEADEAARAKQTKAAARALTLYADATTKDALAQALAWIGKHGGTSEAAAPRTADMDAAAREADARARLAERRPDGAWPDGSGGASLQKTAEELLVLSAHRSALSAQPKTGAPQAAEPLPTFEPAEVARIDAALERGAEYLVGIADAGRFGAPGAPDAGLTAMALGGLSALPEPRPEKVQKALDAGLDWLVSLQREDGSIHDGRLANYVTSAAVLALARSKNPAHAEAVARARDFLVALQADEGEHYSPDDPHYGGIGYGNDERPDLSNLQMSLEALVAAGLDKGDPAFQRALTFLERCQNRSESNDLHVETGEGVIASGDDGGGVYAPGDSEAGLVELADGTRVPRSYGSMTYALLKSYVLAGVPKEDPRMQAVWGWLRENWTLDVNPGMEVSGNPTSAYDGLFYYFATMAKALDLYGDEVVLDRDGRENRWRSQLAGRLIAMQRRTDGSWANQNSSRWWESNPILATSYALIALGVTRG